MRIPAALLLALGLSLQAQALYQPRPTSDAACPRIEGHEDAMFRKGGQYNTTGGIKGAVTDQVMGEASAGVLIPKAERQPGTAFAVYDSANKALPVTELKGKLVVIGFWQTTCGPSLNLLNELVDFQAKGEKFGFEVWPVCLDEGKWAALGPFLAKNRAFVGKTRLYMPGLGEQGPASLMKVLPVLPALFILDREGKVAYQKLGYEPNALVGALKKLIPEK